MINEKHRHEYTAEAGGGMIPHAFKATEFGGGDLKLDVTAPREYLEAFHKALGEYLAGKIYDEGARHVDDPMPTRTYKIVDGVLDPDSMKEGS